MELVMAGIERQVAQKAVFFAKNGHHCPCDGDYTNDTTTNYEDEHAGDYHDVHDVDDVVGLDDG